MHKVYGNINTLKYAIYGDIYEIIIYKVYKILKK